MLNRIRSAIASTMKHSTASAAELRSALDILNPAAHEAEAERLEAERGRMLASDASDAEIEEIDRAISAAWRSFERANARRAAIELQVAEAVAREEDGIRRERYAAAEHKADQAAKRFRAEYPRLAQQIVGLLKELAEADVAVCRANDTLPIGAAPLSGAELRARGYAAEQRELLSVAPCGGEWRYQNRSPVEAPLVQKIESLDGRNGKLRVWGDGWVDVLRVDLERADFLDGRPEAAPPPLAASLHLPPLRVGEPPIFEPLASTAFEIDCIKRDPMAVVKALDASEADRQRPAADRRPERQRVSIVRVKAEG